MSNEVSAEKGSGQLSFDDVVADRAESGSDARAWRRFVQGRRRTVSFVVTFETTEAPPQWENQIKEKLEDELELRFGKTCAVVHLDQSGSVST